MNRYVERLWRFLAEDGEAEAAMASMQARPRALPVVWLLGKTGAGKSSLIRLLTGVSEPELGEGFAPCTRSARTFDFPDPEPLMRFLDTRGLGEAGYDPTEDLAQCAARSHAIFAVARLDDPVQGALADALADVLKRHPGTPVHVVHTGADLIPDPQARFRAQRHNQSLLERGAGRVLPWAEAALPRDRPDQVRGLDQVVDLLDDVLPDVALLLEREDRRGAERDAFARCRAEVLRYASAAGTADVAPLLGTVAVPAVQAAMLRSLGKQYGVSWNRQRLREFIAALGLGFAVRYGAGHVLRQAGKLVPVVGQSAGAAAAGSLSFAATFALGRAAAFYLHRTGRGETARAAELRDLYRDALRRARHERH